MEITDRQLNDFYGEYEPPNVEGKFEVCCDCGEDIYSGEECFKLPNWYKNGGYICSDCICEVLGDMFSEISLSEKIALLNVDKGGVCCGI